MPYLRAGCGLLVVLSTSAIPEITSADGTYRRVMVYSAIIQNGATFTRGVFTQVFSSKGATLTPRGPAKVIQPFQNTSFPGAEQIFNNVSIAEDASFAVYGSFNPACNKETLWFQKLNPVTGSKIGPRKPLLDCSDLTSTNLGAHAVDVLRLR